jgi:predicted kinase
MTTAIQPLVVVQMHGEPGSGKSTLAKALGRALSAVVIDKDVIKAALLRSDISEHHAAPAVYEVFFALASDLARQGHSLILDSPVYWPTIEERGKKLAEDAHATPIMIECVCADRQELTGRLMTRETLESQSKVPFEPQRAGVDFEPLSERLTLDTTRSLADLVAEALHYIKSAASSRSPSERSDLRLPTSASPAQ